MDKKIFIIIIITLIIIFGVGFLEHIQKNKLSEQISQDCEQHFGISGNIGCATTSSCVSGADLTPEHGCASSNGVCPVSLGTYIGAQKFINTFNNLAKGKCTLRVSSALQTNKDSPSRSLCHKPGNEKSGTCIDFNVIPPSDSCFTIFYQAARDSGTVLSFKNEYKSACHEKTQTGGNIHTNFGGEKTFVQEINLVPTEEPIICVFEKSDLWSPQMPWDGSYICRGSIILDFHGLTFSENRTFKLDIEPTPENSGFSEYEAKANIPINKVTFKFSQVGGDYFQKNKPACPVTEIKGKLKLFETVPDIEKPFPTQYFDIDLPASCE